MMGDWVAGSVGALYAPFSYFLGRGGGAGVVRAVVSRAQTVEKATCSEPRKTELSQVLFPSPGNQVLPGDTGPLCACVSEDGGLPRTIGAGDPPGISVRTNPPHPHMLPLSPAPLPAPEVDRSGLCYPASLDFWFPAAFTEKKRGRRRRERLGYFFPAPTFPRYLCLAIVCPFRLLATVSVTTAA